MFKLILKIIIFPFILVYVFLGKIFGISNNDKNNGKIYIFEEAFPLSVYSFEDSKIIKKLKEFNIIINKNELVLFKLFLIRDAFLEAGDKLKNKELSKACNVIDTQFYNKYPEVFELYNDDMIEKRFHFFYTNLSTNNIKDIIIISDILGLFVKGELGSSVSDSIICSYFQEYIIAQLIERNKFTENLIKNSKKYIY